LSGGDVTNAGVEDDAGDSGLQISKNRKIDFENVVAGCSAA
jgi:hypothetical protein